MEIGYYPGCSSYGTSIEFDRSLKEVFRILNVELKEIPDWNCCGASPGHALKEELGLHLSYINLVKAQKANINEILVTCPSCYSNLLKAVDTYVENESFRARMDRLYGKIDAGSLKIYHILDFLKERVGQNAIESHIKVPLKKLKVVSYYGCLTRLPHVNLESKERPSMMDELLSWTGAEVVEDWPFKVYCCGAGLSVPKPDITKNIADRILEGAIYTGANAVSVVCPLCQFNLESRSKFLRYPIPILYLTQIIGFSMGVSPTRLGLEKNIPAGIP